MRISVSMVEDAEEALKRYISRQGKKIMRSRGVTFPEGKAIVVKRIKIGTGSAAGSLGLYAVAHATDSQGNSYTKYIGEDGNYYIENNSTGQIFSV